jgi:methenyltetrahydromethanopterin cyclohydrolase
MQLNATAARLSETMVANAERLRVRVERADCGTRLVDCGQNVPGSLAAGIAVAEICLADRAEVHLSASIGDSDLGLVVTVVSDDPVTACMGSQYAGWRIKAERFFAMGSGPMRAAAGKEPILQRLGVVERPEQAVGVLETRDTPTDQVCRQIADACQLAPERLTLLFAPTASVVGSVQIAARSLETALHKLSELGFDLGRIDSGWGQAPLPPVAADDLAAIGRTNDAVLYGGDVTLLVRGDDASLQAIGPLTPSCSSRDYGQPFATIFERYGRDFYRIDPQLFSPARITFVNCDTGRVLRYGRLAPELVRQSFGLSS